MGDSRFGIKRTFRGHPAMSASRGITGHRGAALYRSKMTKGDIQPVSYYRSFARLTAKKASAKPVFAYLSSSRF
jgi:hypothetical protein